MSNGVDQIVQNAVGELQAEAERIANTTAALVREHILNQVKDPTIFRSSKELSAKEGLPSTRSSKKTKKTKKAAAASNGADKPKRKVSAATRKKLAENLAKARAAKAANGKDNEEANKKRSIAMKKAWAARKAAKAAAEA